MKKVKRLVVYYNNGEEIMDAGPLFEDRSDAKRFIQEMIRDNECNNEVFGCDNKLSVRDFKIVAEWFNEQ